MLSCSSYLAIQCPNVDSINPFSWCKQVIESFATVTLWTQGKKNQLRRWLAN